MGNIHTLEPVDVRVFWPHEAHCFTPWLAENLSLLGAELNLVLEREGEEMTLPGAGRVDILARQATTGARVVIENQLGSSDDSHCLRLLGYAANAEANILVWVARYFSDYHRSILSWLNESDNIAVYAVEVRAFLVDGRKVVDFDLVVEPQAGTTSTPRRKTASTYYAEFYRPVVATLRRSGLLPVGRGGFRGRYRSFQTGYEDVYYSAEISQGRAAAALGVYGDDSRHIFQALTRHRYEIDAELNGETEWHQYWVWLTTEAAVDDPSSIPDEVGEWLTENLLRLREVVQPYLDRVMADPVTSGEDAEEPG
ncbi:MAG: DUF4268 domain-containing protein [Caldilineaceae bacterium]|nr:DUF4268 domain-containing protein [Caldilineaceae bacterium]MDE0500874.1 DUF4268 domain-containing protein [bacterium]